MTTGVWNKQLYDNPLTSNTINNMGTMYTYEDPNAGFFSKLLGNNTVNQLMLNDQWKKTLENNPAFRALSPEQQFQYVNDIVTKDFNPTNSLTVSQQDITDSINRYSKQVMDNKGQLLKTGNSSNDLFGFSTNKEGQTTLGGATGIQWLGAGLGMANSLYGMYNAHQSMKLAKQNFAEQQALNRANYENQAKAMNNSLRNQQSGRSFTGMSGSAQRTLGREYQERKAKEKYW